MPEPVARVTNEKTANNQNLTADKVIKRQIKGNDTADNENGGIGFEDDKLAGMSLDDVTPTALNCGYDCSHYIYSQPNTKKMYDDLTDEQREVIKVEYYHSYDFMIGVRTAASLGGAIALFSLFILYKTKCGSDRRRRRASGASSGGSSSGGGSSWRRSRQKRTPGGEGEQRPLPVLGDFDVDKDGPASFAGSGFPALVSDSRAVSEMGRGGGSGRRDSRVSFPTSLTPLSPAAPSTAGAEIFQFPGSYRLYADRKLSGAACASGLPLYNDAPRLSCGNILPAGYHRPLLRQPPFPPHRPDASASSLLLHYGEIFPRPPPGSRKGFSGGASCSYGTSTTPLVQQQKQLTAPFLPMQSLPVRMKDRCRKSGDPIDIQIIQPTPNVSPCGSMRRLSEDFVTMHSAGVGPRRTLSGGSRPRSSSDNSPVAPLIPLLAIPRVHRGSGQHSKSKSARAKRFRDNSTQMSFETQDGGCASRNHAITTEAGGGHLGATSSDQVFFARDQACSSRSNSYAPVASTSGLVTSSPRVPLLHPDIAQDDDVTPTSKARKPSDGVTAGIRFIDCSDSDGFSLSSDSGAFGCGSLDSGQGSPLNSGNRPRRDTGLVRDYGALCMGQVAPPVIEVSHVLPAEENSSPTSVGSAGIAVVDITAALDTGSTGCRRKVVAAEPDTTVSETQC